jgi:hypothetical protein
LGFEERIPPQINNLNLYSYLGFILSSRDVHRHLREELGFWSHEAVVYE